MASSGQLSSLITSRSCQQYSPVNPLFNNGVCCLHQRRTRMSASLLIRWTENMMRDARTSRPAGRVQTHRSSLAGLALVLSLGLALLSAGCTQPDQGYPLTPSQDPVRIPSLAPVLQAVMPAITALKRHRAGDADENVITGIHLTINGLAAGLRNSG
jgi:hypothetical protein